MGEDELIGMGMQGVGSLVGGLAKIFTAHRQMKMARAINPQRTFYQTSPYALENKGIAENEMNGRMPGAAAAEAGIAGDQAGTIAGAGRVATNSGDALAAAAGSQATADAARQNLATQEAQYGHAATKDVMGANQALVTEGDKVYQDRLEDYNQKLDMKNALMGASFQNTDSAFAGIGGSMMEEGNTLSQMAMRKKYGYMPGGYGYDPYMS